MSKSTREKLQDLARSYYAEIEKLNDKIIGVSEDLMLLCDDTQRFEEKEELVTKREGRKKILVPCLIGRIHWKEDFKDDDTGGTITIERSRVVRVNGVWDL